MLIAIPSKGRAGATTSDKSLPSAVFYVPEGEEREYKQVLGNKIVPVPKEVRGITQTRNWILNNTKEKWVQFVDDDVKKNGWVELMSQHARPRPLKEKEWIRETEKLFALTEDMKLRIWGVATISAPRACYPWRPFIWHTYVTASCMGMINHPSLRFDESFPVKEDYELCLRCLRDDGAVVGARFLFWENSHWSDKGGCGDYRTQGMEKAAIDRLIRMYPGLIRQVTRGGSHYSISLDF